MERQPKVYVPQEPTRFDPDTKTRVPTINLAPAAKFGELVICLPSGLNPVFMAPIVAALKEKLRDVEPEDYLVPTGAPALIAAAAGIAIRKNGKLKVLHWDRQQHVYIPMEIEL